MLKKIYQELVEIRKELQAIRSNQEFRSDKPFATKETLPGTMKANTIQGKRTTDRTKFEDAFLIKVLTDLKEMKDKCDYAYGFAQGFTDRAGHTKHP